MAIPKIVLLQARQPSDPMKQHEIDCFVQTTKLSEKSFDIINLSQGVCSFTDIEKYDAVMLGGSGDFSVVKGGFDWHQPMLDLIKQIIDKRKPAFASCFGFQALVQSLGGELESCPKKGEVGTFEISLTTEGKDDPLFSSYPSTFNAQLGHNDSVTLLPEDLVHLASSQRCHYQAVRVRGTSIVGTQFHPELDHITNLDRYMYYIEHYKQPGESLEEATERAHSIHEEGEEAARLLQKYLEVELGYTPA